MRGKLIFLLLVVMLIGCTPLTPERLLENPEVYLGKTVSITATPTQTMSRCTLMACSIENPCCNSCASSLVIKANEGQILIEGALCRGNECSQTCAPLEKDLKQQISGIFERQDAGYKLILETHETP